MRARGTRLPPADLARLAGRPVVCSWSGGKDCALSLVEAVAAGARPIALLTMLTEGGERSRSHGLRLEVLEAQAAALGLPLMTRAATWAGYEEAFVAALHELRAGGAEAAIFGDIDIASHRGWVEGVCARAGIEPSHPIWQHPRDMVVDRLVQLGIAADVVAVRDDVLPRELLGRRVDHHLVGEVKAHGADAAGENGEYHSVVVAAPLFSRPVPLTWGEVVLRDGVWFADVLLDSIRP